MKYLIIFIMLLCFTCYLLISANKSYQETFEVYTRQKPTSQKVNNLTPLALHKTSFDPSKPTVILVHGWIPDDKETFSDETMKAYLCKGDCNVIIMKWNHARSRDYDKVCSHVADVANTLASAINDLLKTGIETFKITLVGFSLGAQVVGIAGQNTFIKKVGRVVGIDPAGINFRNKKESERISTESGEIVEVVHTTAHVGMTEAVGHIDFFVNGGDYQPGCKSSNLTCSHLRGFKYWIEALNNQKSFVGLRCSNYKEFLHYKCNRSLKAYVADDYESIDQVNQGKYYLRTRDHLPYGLGDQGTTPDRE